MSDTCQCGTEMYVTKDVAICMHCDQPHGPQRDCDKCDRLTKSPGIGPRATGGTR